MTSSQLNALDQTNLILHILPVGNEEAHGPCLPLGTDTLLARAFAMVCYQAAQGIENVSPTILPAIHYGYSPTTTDFKGTISISASVLASTVKSIAMSLYGNSPKCRLIIVNIHGKNELPITLGINEFFDETKNQALLINPYTAFAQELDKESFGRIDNSGKETALLLAALKILNNEDLLTQLLKTSSRLEDIDFPQAESLSTLRKQAVIPFHYEEEEQHISRRTKAPIQDALRYFELSKRIFVQLIEDYISLPLKRKG
jgi:creatinine amidohydrolase/Fe(II)-dependent formamide hydrolase-like protein